MSDAHREYILSFLVDSNPKEGAFNVTQEGSKFSVQYETPIQIPQLAFSIELLVKQVNVFNVNPNIGALTRLNNNNIRVSFNFVLYDLIIPDGNYTEKTLELTIIRLLRVASAGITPLDLFYFYNNPATQKLEIQFNYIDTDLDFTVPNTFSELLGLDPIVYSSGAGPVPLFMFAPNKHILDTTEYFLIKCTDLVHKGLIHNQSYSAIIARVEIGPDHPPGRKIIYEPADPIRISCEELKGIRINKLTFLITDQNDIPVHMMNEDWSMVFEIQYSIKDKHSAHEPIYH